MERFEVTILGCGSAVPAGKHMTTSQLVRMREKVFMVDCGEGAQVQVWKSRIKITKLEHIFISHAHGDHFFGLLPFISSIGLMLDRKAPLHLWVPADLKEHLEYDLKAYCTLPFEVVIHQIDTGVRTIIYEDNDLTVETVPLNHRTPCCGFLFREKPKAPVLLPDKCKEFGVPFTEFKKIKAGQDYVTEDGTVIPNSELTRPNDFQPRSYAFCCDTMYNPEMVPQIKGVTLLYHEATFCDEDADRAAATGHSTSRQAAMIAKEAEVGKLALGHYSIRYMREDALLAQAQEVFPDTVLSDEWMMYVL